MQKESFLIVGLGNPGSKYKRTRHNVGFAVIESFLQKLQTQNQQQTAEPFAFEKKFNSELSVFQNDSNKIILAKPQTFMNLSGEAVHALATFYKIPFEKIVVVHDEIDLPFGTIRVSKDSGPAGHNGVRSIIERLGSQNFARLRVGVAPQAEQIKMPAEKFVLRDFTSEEKQQLDSEVIPLALEAIDAFIREGFETAANKYN